MIYYCYLTDQTQYKSIRTFDEIWKWLDNNGLVFERKSFCLILGRGAIPPLPYTSLCRTLPIHCIKSTLLSVASHSSSLRPSAVIEQWAFVKMSIASPLGPSTHVCLLHERSLCAACNTYPEIPSEKGNSLDSMVPTGLDTSQHGDLLNVPNT